jgi:hypothetical protein
MNITGLSTNGLKLLHETIKRALEEDDALPEGLKKYCVREYSDWRRESEEIEAELTDRLEPFSPITW